MNTPLLTIFAVIALGAFYVVLPVAADTYYRFRKKRVVTCPRSGSFAEICIDARRAACSAIIGDRRLRIGSCTRWPENKGCGEECVRGL